MNNVDKNRPVSKKRGDIFKKVQSAMELHLFKNIGIR